MALIVLFTLGSAVGWLTAILLRQDSVKQSFINIGVGAAGAVASYGLTGEGMKSGAVSPQTLIIGVVGAAVLLAIVAILRREIAR